jgi:DeoR family transcriptional regulator, aga operon transcriptional repressor
MSSGEAIERPETRDRAKRLQTLLDMLAERGRLSVTDAAAALSVSEATVRRDFTTLADQQLVTRTHGGVVAASVAYELPVRYRESDHGSAKERIAGAACDLVKPGMVVAFNGGTTTSATARRLAARADLAQNTQRPAVTVVTNALNIATEMVLRPYIRTVILGGVALPQSYELTGPLATLVLQELWLDMLVLGVDGFSLDGGASCHDEGEAGVNAMMVRRARQVVVVAGSEKLGRRSFARISDAHAIDVLVTDSNADDTVVEGLRAAGISVVLA